MVRRLKNTVVNPPTAPRSSPAVPAADRGDYPDAEREAHDMLAGTGVPQRLGTRAAARAADLVTLLLKKRLFSSPAAFAKTFASTWNATRRRAASRQ